MQCTTQKTKQKTKDQWGATARWAIQWVALCDFWEASVETKGEWLRVSTGGAL